MIRRKDGKHIAQMHVIDTEARTFDDALKILDRKRQNKLISEKKSKNRRPPTLGQQFAGAKFRADILKRHGKISLAPVFGISHNTRISPEKRPRNHPLKDISNDQKRAKMITMFESGTWGTLIRARKNLAKVFDVSIDQATDWLSDCREVL